jgi:hypothetical protein
LMKMSENETEEEKFKHGKHKYWSGFQGGSYVVMAIFGILGLVAGPIHKKQEALADYARAQLAPIAEKISHKQVKPSELEIRLTDLDGDGQKETVMRVQGQDYLLKIDAEGKTQLLKYRIEKTPSIQHPEKKKIVTKVPAEQVKVGELEIRLEDLDDDGKKETITRVQGKDYLMQVDKEGKIQFLQYRVEKIPAVYVPGTTKMITEHDASYQILK